MGGGGHHSAGESLSGILGRSRVENKIPGTKNSRKGVQERIIENWKNDIEKIKTATDARTTQFENVAGI